MIGAAVIRYDSCIGITPSIFALIILAFLSRREFHTYKKFILLGILIAVTILGINLAQQPLATDPLEPERNLVEENSIRILFTDYPDHSRMDKSNLYAETAPPLPTYSSFPAPSGLPLKNTRPTSSGTWAISEKWITLPTK